METKQTTDFTDETFPVIETSLTRYVEKAELSSDGKTVALTLGCAPNDGDSPLLFSMTTQLNTYSDPYFLTFAPSDGASLTSGGEAVGAFDIKQDYTAKTTSADAWTLDSWDSSDGVTYRYAAFVPEQEAKTLVVWLHGLGEGGTENTDPYVTILANKVVALSEAGFQDTVGGAHVIAPQCPTYWMDSDGNSGNFSGGAINADGTSFYTASLEEFIDAYAQKVGAEKIVLAGCSNGGYMTMVLSMSRPDAYAAVVPICEAVPDETITDEQIASLIDLPMYFVYSEDDTTVDPAKHEVPTIERLKAAGKTDETLHVSTTEHVIDTSGQFVDENGDPYQYMGHWSWIYFDNNECECEDGLKAWDFIAENVK
jgi:predicted peptidase